MTGVVGRAATPVRGAAPVVLTRHRHSVRRLTVRPRHSSEPRHRPAPVRRCILARFRRRPALPRNPSAVPARRCLLPLRQSSPPAGRRTIASRRPARQSRSIRWSSEAKSFSSAARSSFSAAAKSSSKASRAATSSSACGFEAAVQVRSPPPRQRPAPSPARVSPHRSPVKIALSARVTRSARCENQPRATGGCSGSPASSPPISSFSRSMSKGSAVLCRLLVPTRVVAHDPCQLGERIVIRQHEIIVFAQMVAVCHAVSRTRTRRPRRQVHRAGPTSALWANGDRYFGGLAHLRGSFRPDQRQAGRQYIRNGLHQTQSGMGQFWIVNLNKA